MNQSLQNVSESFKKATLKAAVTEPLQAATTAGNRRMDGMIAIDSKKVSLSKLSSRCTSLGCHQIDDWLFC